MNKKQTIIVILGPTASGKTELAIETAELLNGEIISADSMLVYKGMDIGTAKPSNSELSKIPHYLIDIIEPYEDYDVSNFIKDAKKAIKDILEKGKIPIICGGTNYYVYSLLEGEYEGPDTNEEIRKRLENIAEQKGSDCLYEMLEKVDSESIKRIHKNNVKRVIRALEVYEITGKPVSEMKKTKGINDKYNIVKIGILTEKKELAVRIEQRIDKMFEAGLIDEVKGLIKKGIKKSKTARQAVGYKEVIKSLEENMLDIDVLKAEIAQDTRHLVKKQLTWLKKDSKILWNNKKELGIFLSEMYA
jgi:tRNA dimethylallyltransferase